MTIPATMRALQQTSLDGPQALRLVTDAPVPSPGPGEVLIRVAAAGLNFLDISRSRGAAAGGPTPPYVAGVEGAGEVVALGHGVTGPAVGSHVIGVGIGGGAFAEYLVLPAIGAVPVPPGWSDEQALGLVVSWPTALAALKPLGRIEPGQTVLIHAAAGGTGQIAVRMAKHYGATVIAAASSGKHEVVQALGADHVLDSRNADLAAEVLRLTDGAGADLVLESVGGATFEASLAATRRVTGRVVVLGLAGGEATVSNWDLVYKHQVQLIGLNIGILIQTAPRIFGEIMAELFGLIAAGVSAPANPRPMNWPTDRRPSPSSRPEPPPASSPSCPERPDVAARVGVADSLFYKGSSWILSQGLRLRRRRGTGSMSAPTGADALLPVSRAGPAGRSRPCPASRPAEHSVLVRRRSTGGNPGADTDSPRAAVPDARSAETPTNAGIPVRAGSRSPPGLPASLSPPRFRRARVVRPARRSRRQPQPWKGFRMNDQAGTEPIHDPQVLERQLVIRENAGDVEGMTALFDPDAVIELNDGRLVRGTEAIREFFTELQVTGLGPEGRKFMLGEQRPALVSGDLALTSTRSIDGDITSEVARRQADGTWLWVIDRWSVNW